jgi:hypothetical protein
MVIFEAEVVIKELKRYSLPGVAKILTELIQAGVKT